MLRLEIKLSHLRDVFRRDPLHAHADEFVRRGLQPLLAHLFHVRRRDTWIFIEISSSTVRFFKARGLSSHPDTIPSCFAPRRPSSDLSLFSLRLRLGRSEGFAACGRAFLRRSRFRPDYNHAADSLLLFRRAPASSADGQPPEMRCPPQRSHQAHETARQSRTRILAAAPSLRAPEPRALQAGLRLAAIINAGASATLPSA